MGSIRVCYTVLYLFPLNPTPTDKFPLFGRGELFVMLNLKPDLLLRDKLRLHFFFKSLSYTVMIRYSD